MADEPDEPDEPEEDAPDGQPGDDPIELDDQDEAILDRVWGRIARGGGPAGDAPTEGEDPNPDEDDDANPDESDAE